MRVFHNVEETFSELRRDLNSFGTINRTLTMQNKDIGDDPSFLTKELTNYSFILMDGGVSDFDKIPTFRRAYTACEIQDRLAGINGYPSNPGNSWMLWRRVWEPLLRPDGKFDYTYSERLNGLFKMTDLMIKDPGNRRIWWPIFWEKDAQLLIEKQSVRVPCSLGYQFQIRDNKLLMTYIMRSCDLMTHWANDLYMASWIQAAIAYRLNIKAGSLTMMMHSLHVYAKDVAGDF